MAADGVRTAVTRRDRSPSTEERDHLTTASTRSALPAAGAQRHRARSRLGFGGGGFRRRNGRRPASGEEPRGLLRRRLPRGAVELPRLKVLPVGGGALLEHYRRRSPPVSSGPRTRIYRRCTECARICLGHGRRLPHPRLERGLFQRRDRADGRRPAHDRHRRGRQCGSGRDGESGCVIPAGAVRCTRQALRRLHDDAPLREARGSAAARGSRSTSRSNRCVPPRAALPGLLDRGAEGSR